MGDTSSSDEFSSTELVQPDESETTLDGMMPEVGELFRDHPEGSWDEYIPDNVTRNVGKSKQMRRKAFIVRRQRESPKSSLELHSIVVYSPFLRRMLDRTFQDYEGISTKLKKLQFYAPLHEFYYRWHRLVQQGKAEENEEASKHFELFHDVLGKEILPHIDTMQDYTTHGVVTYDYLWAIFPPGIDVYSLADEQDRIYQVVRSSYDRFSFNLECTYIDCDGEEFHSCTCQLTIGHFDGVVKIPDLDSFPAHLHPQAVSTLERLQSRGEAFEKLKGFHHVGYSGFYRQKSNPYQGGYQKRFVDQSRIIVDAKTHDRQVPSEGPRRPQHFTEKKANRLDYTRVDGDPEMLDEIRKATKQQYELYTQSMDIFDRKAHEERREGCLTAHQSVLCAPTVRGFCLRTKEWGQFYVKDITDIVWNSNAFEQLVLPDGNKDIIHAFVQEQLSHGECFDDIVEGKGRGFIMLLAGEPGVGKTLTAESVAEKMKRPLYSMSAGEMGETAKEVEHSVERVLELAALWDAVLLLDECDIFLEERSTKEIKRNRLVAIFLRQLEYFKGVMFLTTNRSSTLDAAFESRIHITIQYPALDEKSRLHVWRTFITGGGNHNVSEQDLAQLAQQQLNGRQIKNLVKTARLLAKRNRRPLGVVDLELVLQVKIKSKTIQQDATRTTEQNLETE